MDNRRHFRRGLGRLFVVCTWVLILQALPTPGQSTSVAQPWFDNDKNWGQARWYFVDTNGNGLWDQGEPYNPTYPSDGQTWNSPNPWVKSFFNDANANGVHDPGEHVAKYPQVSWTRGTTQTDNSCWLAAPANLVSYLGVESPYQRWCKDGVNGHTFDDSLGLPSPGDVLRAEGYRVQEISKGLFDALWLTDPIAWTKSCLSLQLPVVLGIKGNSVPNHVLTAYSLDGATHAVTLADSDRDEGAFTPYAYSQDTWNWFIENYPGGQRWITYACTFLPNMWRGAGNGGTSGQWSLSGNWSVGEVPNDKDLVEVAFSSAGHLDIAGNASACRLGVYGDVGTLHVQSGANLLVFRSEYIGDSGTTTVTQDGGVHTIGRDLELGRLTGGSGTYQLSGGQLSALNLYVGRGGTGVFSWSGGTLSASRVEVGPGGTFAVTGHDWSYAGNLAITGSLDMRGHFLTLDSGAAATLDADGVLNGGYLEIGFSGAASFLQTGGANNMSPIIAYGSGSSGTYELRNGELYSGYETVGMGGNGLFVQYGGVHRVGSQLCLGYWQGASGVYELNAGELDVVLEYLGCSGTATFIQKGGTHRVDDHIRLGGNPYARGYYQLSGGTLDVSNGTLEIGASDVGSLTWSGGNLSAARIELRSMGTMTVGQDWTYGGSLSLSGGTLNMGGHTLTVDSSGVLSGYGTVTGAVTNNYRLYSDGGTLVINGTLTNHASVWASAGSTLNVTGNISSNDGSVVVDLGATLRSGAGGTIGLFENRGTLDLQGGTLQLSGGGTSPGTFRVASGSELRFSGGTHNLTGATFLVNSGTIACTGATVQIDSLVLVPGNARLTSGSITGAGKLVFIDNLVWSGGSMTGTGTTEIAPGAWLALSGTSYLARTLTSPGGAVLSGTLTVDGSGSKWTNAAELHVAWNGTGMLNIRNGGQVSNTNGYVGRCGGSSGTAVVDGRGSNWTSSGDLYVGYSGTGTLDIRNGGKVSNTEGHAGRYSGSSGAVTVDGTESRWISSTTVCIGYSGTGTLNILNGGQVTSREGRIGEGGGSVGTTTVDGSGSKWANSWYLFVSDFGTGTLNIQNGGLVSNPDGYVGWGGGSSGTVTVDGSGSLWRNSGSLYLGGSSSAAGGTGSVTVRNGGQLTVGRALQMWKADSAVAVNAGTLTAGALAGSTGSIRITDPAGGAALTVGSETSGTFSGTLLDDTGPGSLTKIGTGTQVLAGAGITYTGATTVLGGTLRLSDTAAFASDILNGATTEFEVTAGTWTLHEAIGGAGAFVKCGDGTLVIAGLQDYDSGALFDVVGGTLVLDTDAGIQGADLSISVLGAELRFAWNQHLDTLTIGDGGEVVFAGAHCVVLKHLVMNGVDFGATTLTPEPTTLALLALGGLALLGRRRK